MLTVDYAKLEMHDGRALCSISVAVAAATRSRRQDAEPGWLRSTQGPTRSQKVRDTLGAMVDAGEIGDHARNRARSKATPFGSRFPDGAFDRVIAAEVLEHIPDDTDAMASWSGCSVRAA